MISKETIDQIFSTARVEEVIGDFIQLKKSGSNYKGLSPFSNEKTPSFMVSPAKQIWKDFSSGKGGSVVSFLMEQEQYTYPEALRWLAKRYNIEIKEDRERTPEEVVQAQERENLYTLTEFASRYFTEQLNTTEEGRQIGMSYFKERGFAKETIEKFQLGYSPKAWSAFTAHAKEKGYTYEVLKKAGFTVGNEERPVDRFRERVIFPIHSSSGRVLGFGGRILNTQAKAAKYLNSPENEIYHKSKILYGIYQARQQIVKKDQCILVEGYTDVLSLHQSGMKNVVASSGTALTPDQIRLIKRLTENLILVYDGDEAGIKASFRGIDLILEQELNAKVIVLPDGEDPDSFAKSKSESELQQFFEENAVDFIKFKIQVLKEDAGDDTVKQAEMVQSIVKSIALIGNMIKRELYLREASELLGIREEVLFHQLAAETNALQTERKRRRQTSPVSAPPLHKVTPEKEIPVVDPFVKVEEDIIQTIIKYGDTVLYMPHHEEKGKYYKTTVLEEIIWQLEEDDLYLSTTYYSDIYAEFKASYEQNKKLSEQYFLQHEDQKINQIFTDFMFEEKSLSDWLKINVRVPEIKDNLDRQVQEMMLNYKRLHVKKRIKELKNQVLKEGNTEEEREEILKKIIKQKAVLMKIDSLLGRVV